MNEENMPLPSEEVPEVEVKPKKKRFFPALILAVALILIFGAGIALGFWVTSDSNELVEESLFDNYFDELDEETEEDEDDDVDEEEDVAEEEGEIIVGEGIINVDWLDVEDQYPVSSNYTLTRILLEGYDSSALSQLGAGAMTYVLGTVASGEYTGREVHYFMAGMPGMGVSVLSFYMLVSDEYGEAPVIIDNYSSSIHLGIGVSTAVYLSLEELLWNGEWPEIIEDFIVDTGSTIPELEFSEAVVEDQAGNKLERSGLWLRQDHPYQFSESNYEVVTFLVDGTPLREYVYDENLGVNLTAASHRFYDVREDGRIVWYDIDVPFWTDPYQGEEANPSLITWNDGVANDNEYLDHSLGGCGAADAVRVITDSEIIGSLVSVGSYSVNGETGTIYGPADYDTEYYRESFESWQNFYEEKVWEDFVADHPIIYWQDPFDRWIEFKATDVIPAAECGKPVIYLYPEEPIEVGVEIELEKMSVSEPDYGDGWDVIAYPDGTLVNLSDGQEYPYLFWEGTGKSYSSPENYWVIEQAEVEKFLVETLDQLGFNSQEIADFNEFWLPLMQDTRYYKIGFHGTYYMNQLAPLDFTVRPNSLLRVLMDFEPLEAPTPDNPPQYLPSFERNGFVVTEWGGILR